MTGQLLSLLNGKSRAADRLKARSPRLAPAVGGVPEPASQEPPPGPGGGPGWHPRDGCRQLLRALPHDWAFPRLAAVAHHGGAGTTAAGLSAGVPTVICPFGADQPFWGQVTHQLGAGPRPIPQKRLTAPALAAALRQAVHDPGMRGRAQALSRQLSAENGAHAAAQWVEANLGGHR